MKLITFISVTVASKTKDARQELLEKRKAAFKEKNEARYNAILASGIEIDGKHVNDLLSLVFNMLSIDPADFEKRHEALVSNQPEKCRAAMQGRKTSIDDN